MTDILNDTKTTPEQGLRNLVEHQMWSPQINSDALAVVRVYPFNKYVTDKEQEVTRVLSDIAIEHATALYSVGVHRSDVKTSILAYLECFKNGAIRTGNDDLYPLFPNPLGNMDATRLQNRLKRDLRITESEIPDQGVRDRVEQIKKEGFLTGYAITKMGTGGNATLLGLGIKSTDIDEGMITKDIRKILESADPVSTTQTRENMKYFEEAVIKK